jgi:hypothetical protein
MRITIALLALFAASVSCAQDTDTRDFTMPRSLIKISPFQFFANTLELGVESFNASYSRSFQATVGFRTGSGFYDEGKGIHLEFAYRKFVTPMELRNRRSNDFYQGIYYSFYAGTSYFEGENTSYSYYDPNTGQVLMSQYSATIVSLTPGFTLGLERTFWRVVILDVYVGGGIRLSKADYSGSNYDIYDSDVFDPAYDGIYPKIGAKIGVKL